VSLRPECENARHCEAASVADAEPPGGHPQCCCSLRRAAGEPHLGRGARRPVNYHIGERHARTETRSERLEHCLLGGEPPRQTLYPIGFNANLVELRLVEATRNQWVARIVDPAPLKKSRFNEEQIIAILREQEAGAKTADVCRKHGISTAAFYQWKAKYGGLEVSEARRLKALTDENAKLKKLLAEAMLDNAMLKDLNSKKW